LPARHSFCGLRMRVLLVVLVVTAIPGLIAGVALADEPPVTTTVPTQTEPTPEPAPTPDPPKSAKKPTPKKSTPPPAPRPSRRTQTPPVSQSPSTPAVITPSRLRPQVRPKDKKVAQRPHRKKKVHKKVTPAPAAVPALPSGPPVGASAGLLPAAPGTNAGSAFNIGGLVVILGCVLAITCFGIALVPATVVPWRPVAGFIAERQLDLTLTGLTLLVAVLAFYFLAGV
jgi:cytoskeletal protein RodZ